jgi:hypothetical protein
MDGRIWRRVKRRDRSEGAASPVRHLVKGGKPVTGEAVAADVVGTVACRDCGRLTAHWLCAACHRAQPGASAA